MAPRNPISRSQSPGTPIHADGHGRETSTNGRSRGFLASDDIEIPDADTNGTPGLKHMQNLKETNYGSIDTEDDSRTPTVPKSGRKRNRSSSAEPKSKRNKTEDQKKGSTPQKKKISESKSSKIGKMIIEGNRIYEANSMPPKQNDSATTPTGEPSAALEEDEEETRSDVRSNDRYSDLLRIGQFTSAHISLIRSTKSEDSEEISTFLGDVDIGPFFQDVTPEVARRRIGQVRPYAFPTDLTPTWSHQSVQARLNYIEGLQDIEQMVEEREDEANIEEWMALAKAATELRKRLQEAQLYLRDPETWEEYENSRTDAAKITEPGQKVKIGSEKSKTSTQGPKVDGKETKAPTQKLEIVKKKRENWDYEPEELDWLYDKSLDYINGGDTATIPWTAKDWPREGPQLKQLNLDHKTRFHGPEKEQDKFPLRTKEGFRKDEKAGHRNPRTNESERGGPALYRKLPKIKEFRDLVGWDIYGAKNPGSAGYAEALLRDANDQNNEIVKEWREMRKGAGKEFVKRDFSKSATSKNTKKSKSTTTKTQSIADTASNPVAEEDESLDRSTTGGKGLKHLPTVGKRPPYSSTGGKVPKHPETGGKRPPHPPTGAKGPKRPDKAGKSVEDLHAALAANESDGSTGSSEPEEAVSPTETYEPASGSRLIHEDYDVDDEEEQSGAEEEEEEQ
jgi:hypothetical protein